MMGDFLVVIVEGIAALVAVDNVRGAFLRVSTESMTATAAPPASPGSSENPGNRLECGGLVGIGC
jgi:hypothetical protein